MLLPGLVDALLGRKAGLYIALAGRINGHDRGVDVRGLLVEVLHGIHHILLL